MLEVLPIEKLSPAEENPRRDVGNVDELAASIKAAGIIEPLVVVPENGGYTVVAGARRLAAAAKAGLDELPCLVRTLTAEQRIEVMVIENLQREDLAPLEEASAYQALEGLGWTQRQIAERVGRNQSHISRRVALLGLPEKAARALDAGDITVADALELTKLKDMPKRLLAALKEGTDRGWRDVTAAVKWQLQDHQDQVRRGDALRELKAKGVKVIDRPDSSHWSTYQNKEKEIGRGYDQVSVDPKKHEAEPCHRVAVLGNGETVPLCASPARHAKKDGKSAVKTGLTDAEKTRRRKKVEHNRARREANAVRAEFTQALVGRRVTAHAGLLFLVNAWCHQRYGAGAGLDDAFRMLGLPEPRKARGYGTDSPYGEAIQKYAAETVSNAARAAAALAIAFHEKAQLTTDYPMYRDVGLYFDLLKEHGYEASPAERLELAGKAPR